jgi:membrane protein DedA with SNARE-associated domain
MKSSECKAGIPTDVSGVARMGAGSWTILIVLLSLLALTLVVVYFGWTYGKDADVPTSGYVAMAIGVIVSLAVGFGLMALVFYSSRKGYDEPPVLIVPAEAIKSSGRSGEPPKP